MRIVAEDEIRILRNVARGDPPNPTDETEVPLTNAATYDDDIQNAHFFAPDGRGFITRRAYRHYMRRHYLEEWRIVRGNYQVQVPEPEAEQSGMTTSGSDSSIGSGPPVAEDEPSLRERSYPRYEYVTPDQVINQELASEEEGDDGNVDSSRPWIGLEGNSDVGPSQQQQATINASTSSSSNMTPSERDTHLDASRRDIASLIRADAVRIYETFPSVSFVSPVVYDEFGSGRFIRSELIPASMSEQISRQVAQEAKAKAKAKAAPPRVLRRGSSSEDNSELD